MAGHRSLFGSMASHAATTMLAPLLTVLLLWSPFSGGNGQVVQSNTPGNITGTMTSLELAELLFYLTYDAGPQGEKIFRVIFCADVPLDAIPIATPVNLKYDEIVDGIMHSCSVPVRLSDQQQQQPQQQPGRRRIQQQQQLGGSISTPLQPRLLFYIPTFCGFNAPAAVTPERVLDLVFTGKWTWRNRWLANYFDFCSYGQVSIQPSNVKVLSAPEVPCSGTIPQPNPYNDGGIFTSTSCDRYDSMTKCVQYWLDAWAAKTHGVNASDYHHRILILPNGFAGSVAGCGGFAGKATAGRISQTRTPLNAWGSGHVWWSGNNFGDLEILFHELSHNYAMAHANVVGGCLSSDQCDHTCIMGATGGQGIRCFNAPHNWQVGWASKPVEELDDSDLPYGISTSVLIPAQMSGLRTSVLVRGAGMPANRKLFLSVRLNSYSYDLPWQYWDDKVPFLLMHTYDGTDGNPYSTTVIVGEIKVDDIWRDLKSNISVRFDSWSNDTGAVVRICRRSSGEERNCGDGLDEDCDFLTDAGDPNCKAGASSETAGGEVTFATGGRPSTPPRRSPPPRPVLKQSPPSPKRPSPPSPRPPRRLLPPRKPAPPRPPRPPPRVRW
ncbi:hypothetical protein Vretimale_18171 [Volvox reticuliferus]|nr:hypothetical protein Vretimale_18171 [Volvox reticuliferus]